MYSLEILKTILMLVTILASQVTSKNVHTFMQDANNKNSTEQPTPPSVKMLEKEVKQLQTERDWYKAEYQKLVKMFIAQNKRSERHISGSNTPWLPFAEWIYRGHDLSGTQHFNEGGRISPKVWKIIVRFSIELRLPIRAVLDSSSEAFA